MPGWWERAIRCASGGQPLLHFINPGQFSLAQKLAAAKDRHIERREQTGCFQAFSFGNHACQFLANGFFSLLKKCLYIASLVDSAKEQSDANGIGAKIEFRQCLVTQRPQSLLPFLGNLINGAGWPPPDLFGAHGFDERFGLHLRKLAVERADADAAPDVDVGHINIVAHLVPMPGAIFDKQSKNHEPC